MASLISGFIGSIFGTKKDKSTKQADSVLAQQKDSVAKQEAKLTADEDARKLRLSEEAKALKARGGGGRRSLIHANREIGLQPVEASRRRKTLG